MTDALTHALTPPLAGAHAPGGRTSLRDDQRGAVMMTGLFMAFVLVGALWFVIGIGDAVIFRDRMQEAADHSAFTSAALHAKGMNFISACNIVMLIMVAVHVVLGLIHDFALAACILTLGVGCTGWVTARRAYEGYARFMKPALTAINKVETVAATGYPWLGTVKGFQVGASYGNQGRVGGVNTFVLGPSNLPAARTINGGGNNGLPVGPQPMNRICSKIAGVVADFGRDVAGDRLGLIGQLFGGPVMDIVQTLVGGGIKYRYCNDLTAPTSPQAKYFELFQKGRKKIDVENEGRDGDNAIDRPQTASTSNGDWSSTLDPGFDRGWKSDGPLVINTGAHNGSDQFSVWSINMGPTYRETNERRVNVARGHRSFGAVADSDQGGSAYFAQAEFYYDCETTWAHDGCNGGVFEYNASFAIKWRARLRRVSMPNFGALLAGFAFDKVVGSPGYKNIRNVLAENNAAYEALAGKGPLGKVGVTAVRSVLNRAIKHLEGAARGAVTDAAGTPTHITGSYH